MRILAISGISFGVTFANHTLSAAQTNSGNVPYFEDSICWSPMPRQMTLRCGYLHVPEVYHVTTSRELILPVLIFNEALSSNLPPVLYIEGGPGSDAGVKERNAGRNWEEIIAQIALFQDRPVIVMAQRGTADETSALIKCSALGEPKLRFGLTNTPHKPDFDQNSLQKTLEDCRTSALNAGYNLQAYSTQNAVNDLVTLRTSLKVRKWDIFANSYGSRIAVLLADQDPDGIGKMILDGPDMPGSYASLEVGRWITASFAQLQKDCNTREKCHAGFPDLFQLARTSVTTLAANTEWIGFRKGNEQRNYYINLTEERALNTLFNAFYSDQAVNLLPRALFRANRKDYSVFGALSGALFLDPFYESRSYGMAFSVDCADFERKKAHDILEAEKMRDVFFIPLIDARLNTLESLCPLWLGKDYEQHISIPEEITIPTLVLTGVYDPVTPIQSFHDSPTRFTNVQAIALPALGHGVIFANACAAEIAFSFLNSSDHSADTSCIASMKQIPDFILDRSPPPNTPFIEMKTYSGATDRRSN